MMLQRLRAKAAAIPPPLAGFLLIVLASAFFASMHNTVRFVTVGEGVHPFEAVFFRNLFGIVVFIPWLLKNGLGGLRTERFGMHLGRAGLNSISMLSWFTALKRRETYAATFFEETEAAAE